MPVNNSHGKSKRSCAGCAVRVQRDVIAEQQCARKCQPAWRSTCCRKASASNVCDPGSVLMCYWWRQKRLLQHVNPVFRFRRLFNCRNVCDFVVLVLEALIPWVYLQCWINCIGGFSFHPLVEAWKRWIFPEIFSNFVLKSKFLFMTLYSTLADQWRFYTDDLTGTW